MIPPPGYELRAARFDDLDGVAAVEAAYDTVDFGRPYVDRAWLAEDWSKPRFDPGRDAWVVTRPEIVAYAQTYAEEPGTRVEGIARVHPGHWGRGLGSVLAARMEDRAAEQARSGSSLRFVNVVSATDRRARELLERRGYTIDRHFWHMSIDLTRSLPVPEPADGVAIDVFDLDRDAASLHRVLGIAFADHYGHIPTPFDEWRSIFDTPAYVPGLWFVAREGGTVVGVVTARTLIGEGWVMELGVLPESRGRGVAGALLARAFRALRERGLTVAALNVDAHNETGATALYERVGMHVRRRWDLYAKFFPGVSPKA